MQRIFAEKALTADGWQSDITITVNTDGMIDSISKTRTAQAERVGILLPAPGNLHSHAFQRAMAGMTEHKSPDPHDNFWTWREMMYRFLDHLTPEDVESITAFAQMEMLEAGYAAVGEFHYLHHQPDGQSYADIAEIAKRIIAAAGNTGIGLTMLPVYYERGGCDNRPLTGGQRRFGNELESFARLVDGIGKYSGYRAADSVTGIAPHSLRAVSADSLQQLAQMLPRAPLHMHIAEQIAEVEEVRAVYGARPVEWLLANQAVDARWCLIHCTHMTAHETKALARSRAIAGLCPVTEANLGDGIFNGTGFVESGGQFGIGSDSNIRISLSEELRQLEYSQRLRDHARAVLARHNMSCGRLLFEEAAHGSAQALGRNSGMIEIGRIADLLALDVNSVALAGCEGDEILDSYIFAGDDSLVTDVWSAGRHVVRENRHIEHEKITANYRRTMTDLRSKL
jgi:formimidoylglutamate deiminase